MSGDTCAVLDVGVLLDAGARESGAWALKKMARGSRELVVTTPVLAQAWGNGALKAALARFLKGCVLDTPSEGVAKEAGELLGRAGAGEVVGAIVVATAIELGAAMIFTSDPGDIGLLVEAANVAVPPLIQKV